MADSKLKVEKQHDLGVLEEDDEFEEFPAEDWKQVNDGKMVFLDRLLILLQTRRSMKSGKRTGKMTTLKMTSPFRFDQFRENKSHQRFV